MFETKYIFQFPSFFGIQPLDFGSVSKIQLNCQALGDEPMRGIILYVFNTENHEHMSKVATCRG